MTTIDPAPIAGANERHGLEMPDAVGERIDGRVLRGLRNRRALVNAYYELAGETGEAPRAAVVAERAGVSVRSLFQHFADLDDLRAATVDEMCERAIEILMLEAEGVDASLPLQDRLDHALRVRAVLWEMLKPLRTAHLLRDGGEERESTSATLARVRDLIREHLQYEFAAELSRLSLDDEMAVSALQVTLSSATWDHFRFVNGYDIETTISMMRHLAMCVLHPGYQQLP